MSIKPILALLGFVGWSFLCTQWYCCWMQVACESCGVEAYAEFNAAPIVPVAPVKTAAKVPFEYSKIELSEKSDPKDFLESMLAGKQDDNILEITGLYFEGEEKPQDLVSLGLSRADELKKLLAGKIAEDRIITKARLVKEPEGAKERGFYGVDFKWLDADKTTAATLEQFSDKVVIRFPYNSVQKDYDPEVDAYLIKLAERVIASKEKIAITGHTDDTGKDDYNIQLGMKRAESIKAYLMKKGVTADQITVDSKGKNQPVAANDSDANKHANRRAEVVIVQ